MWDDKPKMLIPGVVSFRLKNGEVHHLRGKVGEVIRQDGEYTILKVEGKKYKIPSNFLIKKNPK